MPNRTIGFRPTDEDRRILDAITSSGLSTTDAIRRGLHLVAHEQWLDLARADAERLRDENVNDAPDAW
ncbi:hypothetical protein [Cellulosimicrobium marinum]|uniref:hypothetical protein n=1 Tax=Cellulosimicrobium marinum TaxID=1638992 RepID=UPI001E2C1E41|nr:hypothetical protein [Cellulosimicrobium marinum]MCB7135543.1 hypothetical protein [Cellulosimicrobium marinum]